MSEKKRISNDRWIKENYKQVKLSMPNKEAEALEAHCAKFNYSKAGFIRQAIKDKMQADQQRLLSTSNNNNSNSEGD